MNGQLRYINVIYKRQASNTRRFISSMPAMWPALEGTATEAHWR